jgi:hypothetical protein
MEGRQQLKDISNQLLDKLKKTTLPIKSARAEAYGENCIAEDGSLVSFSTRETDFYVTLSVVDIQDEAMLGTMLEQTITIIDLFPPDQTPGPLPGYVGITFESGNTVHNLWFTQTQASQQIAQGKKGADLYRILNGTP